VRGAGAAAGPFECFMRKSAMFASRIASGLKTKLAAAALAAGILLPMSPPAAAQSAAGPAAAAPYRYRLNRPPRRAGLYFGLVWGVDSLGVKWAESGEIIRFTWRVLDAAKAVPLSDKKLQPVLIDQQAGVKLVVPSLEKVGQLRQSSTPEAGRSYWMAFSNKGRLVKRGDRVTVVIGQFRADGLVVD
jgi:hypothetical protein